MKIPAISVILAIGWLSGSLAIAEQLSPPKHPLELRDGERVALLGGTNMAGAN